MKITIITDAAPPQINGVVTTLKNLQHWLRMAGHQVAVISPSDFTTFSLPFYNEIRIPIFPFSLLSTIKHDRPDIIHIATEGILGLVATIYCRNNKIPYITSFHTDWETTLGYFSIPGNKKLIRSYLKYIHGGAKVTLVTNEEMRISLSKRGFSNLKTWTRGVDVTLFNPMEKRDLKLEKPILLCVSRVSPEKNLEAFLNLDIPGTKILVGGGPLLDEYKSKYSNVIFTGSLTGNMLSQYYASADVFVFPSKTDTFGLVMLESIASGTPVAAYPVTGPIGVIENGINGYMDNDLLVATINALNVDRTSTELSAHKWTWKGMVDIYLKTIDEYFNINAI